jgi:hypothetical protein
MPIKTTTFGGILQHLGGVPVMAGVPYTMNSKYYFVDARNGSDGNDGLTPATALATIIAAEDKCTANQHDTIFLLGTGTAVSMTAALTWDKSYTHLIGICAPTQVAQRARIAHEDATYTGLSPLFNVTASGCIFKNVYCFQGVADATSLINWQVSGGRNYFENVHFAGGGNASMAIDGCASLRLVGSEGENTFVHCTLGVDTIAAATGVRCLAITGGTPRNIFRNCNFTLYSAAAGAMFVEWEALSAVDRYMLFDRCNFFNTGATTMSEAFSIPASVPSHRRCFLKDCWGYGFTDWEANDRGVLYISGGTATAGGYTGLYQASTVA